eukprot:TRINITY_DN1683_c0_g2_i1.p1 TRINITY_DN1683_c0_g2~~TRINITY_DN1683_c0_g2_i1.p1  ORF type:complete len:317 (+),score=69.75 TRINITY_DN1683_c0_g2_i1:2-952(+)
MPAASVQSPPQKKQSPLPVSPLRQLQEIPLPDVPSAAVSALDLAARPLATDPLPPAQGLPTAISSSADDAQLFRDIAAATITSGDQQHHDFVRQQLLKHEHLLVQKLLQSPDSLTLSPNTPLPSAHAKPARQTLGRQIARSAVHAYDSSLLEILDQIENPAPAAGRSRFSPQARDQSPPVFRQPRTHGIAPAATFTATDATEEHGEESVELSHEDLQIIALLNQSSSPVAEKSHRFTTNSSNSSRIASGAGRTDAPLRYRNIERPQAAARPGGGVVRQLLVDSDEDDDMTYELHDGEFRARPRMERPRYSESRYRR